MLSHLWLLQPHGLEPARLLCPWDFPGNNTVVGCVSFSKDIKYHDKYLCCFFILSSVQLLSCVWLFCDPMDCSTKGFPVHHQLPELAKNHVHRVGDAIQPSNPLLFCCPLHLLPLIFPSISSVSSVQFSQCLTLCSPKDCNTPGLPLSPTPGACSNSGPSSQWCHPTFSSSTVTSPYCLQSFPALKSFPKRQFFASGGQSMGISASASVFPMNIHDLFPLGLTGLISLQSKGLSRVFSNTTVQKHQLFGAQLYL